MLTRVHAILSAGLISICCQTCLGRLSENREPSANVSSAEAASVGAAIMGKIEVSPRSQGLAIEITLSAPVVPKSDRATNPDRLIFDFPGCEPQGGNRRIPVDRGPVRELRLALFQAHPPITRIVVDSKEPLDFNVKAAENNVVIEIVFRQAEAALPASHGQSGSVERDHPPGGGKTPKQAEPESAGQAAGSRPTAYGLQAKANALTPGDLQGLEDKAAAGDPEAQTTLALGYHSGILLRRDDGAALRLLRKAADQGFMAAQESMGIFSETGIGMERPSPAEALDWYKKAGQQGSLDAATNIALMYAQGRGVAKDPVQAVSWFLKAAEGGDSVAQYNLALMYERGDGIPQDYKESVRWMTAAADQNLLPALLDLASFYMHAPDGATPDVDRAVGYYEKAAELGDAQAQAILGSIFANGVHGKPDFDQSAKWYRMAADQGQRDGEAGLAVRYATGEGVPVDLQEARRLFTAAAEQGQAEAQYDLGTLCEEGKGGAADPSLAAHYYQLAAEQGLSKAQYHYGKLLANDSESRSDRITAYKWLMLAQDSIKESSAVLSDLRKYMDPQEIVEAERDVDNWRIAHRAR